jgi:hypothetical protein
MSGKLSSSRVFAVLEKYTVRLVIGGKGTSRGVELSVMTVTVDEIGP